MSPYYADDGVTIYHADCRDILAALRADAIVTDPPYGIADAPNRVTDHVDGTRQGKRGGGANDWHPESLWDREFDPTWLALALAVGPVALFGHWRRRLAFETVAGMEPRAEIIWAKDTHVGAPCPVAMRDERIWIFAHAPIVPRRFETSVWDEPIIPTWQYRHHRNEKPLALMKRLIAWLPVASVIDPFMGSGTTIRAAKDLRVQAIGIEIDERYCEIAAGRCAQMVLDLDVSP